ncbi:MAG: peptidoglycan-binding protein [Candidatus Colwellbacteria bacterium]|nr:peptidoglycan-binding protein [Candidatus Colwellbacteria bacterium]
MTENKIKLISKSTLLAALVIASLGLVQSANAGVVVFSADTNVTMTGTSNITLKALSGSQVDSYIVSPTTVTVTVTGTDTFTLYSADRYNVTNNGNITQTCAGNYSQTIVRGGTVILTPGTTACQVAASGGGGGGGGGTAQVDYEPPTNTSVVIAAGAVTASSTAVTLTLGATGATQMMISNVSDFKDAVWETYTTSKAWTLTSGDGVKTVYVRFRDASQNVSVAVTDTITLTTGVAAIPATPATPAVPGVTPAVPATPATPATPAVLKALPYAKPTTIPEMQANLTVLLENLAALQASQKAAAPSAVPSAAIPSSGSYTQPLSQGSKGGDVTALQNLLKSEGVYPEGLVTGYFGNLTQKAVGKFQEKYGIADSNNPGYGFVGPKTRAKINSLLGL